MWIERLKDGRRKQVRGQLIRGVKKVQAYCCLGVACELSNELKLVRNINLFDDNDHMNVLPNRLAKRLNITAYGKFINKVEYKGRRYDSLVELNDAGVRFPTIARIIREQWDAKNFQPFQG
jgi:transposase